MEFYTKVAGITFEGREELVEELYEDGELDVGQQLILERRPDNPFDSNAVAVVHPSGATLGFIPKEKAAIMSPKMYRGTHYTAEVTAVTGGSGYDSHYGINLLIKEI
ncbi:MAG: HIRAN domain-containing protein [Clostridia bacterium]|nr:HIRAN domain-containing protein [Clostridia bacterium]